MRYLIWSAQISFSFFFEEGIGKKYEEPKRQGVWWRLHNLGLVTPGSVSFSHIKGS